MSTLLGIYQGNHSSSCAVVKDGEIINVIEEERLSRIKAGDRHETPCDLSYNALKNYTGVSIENSDFNLFIEPVHEKFVREFTKGKYEKIKHHDAHCYGAYYTSGMDGKVLVISYDGGGESTVLKIYYCEDGKMNLFRSEPICEYGSLSHLWGFSTSGIKGYDEFFEGVWKICKDEGKLMGMAADGHYDEKIYKMLSSVIKYENLKFYPAGTSTKTMILIDMMRDMGYFNSQEKMEIFCYNLQKITNDLFLKFLNDLHKLFPDYKKICFSGGLFGNVKLNQKINELDWVEEIYVMPPMGDEGLALGACIKKSVDLGEWLKPKKLENVYFGMKYSNEEIERISKNYNFQRKDLKIKEIAKELNDGKIIGWFKSGSEHGPRALGARSILVRPTDVGTHKILNERLKRHDTMPFAPIILSEYFEDIFYPKKSLYAAQFMTICYETKVDWIEKIPAVIQKSDKTARPQVVFKENLPQFWEILNEYYLMSGIPVLLNTSFNSHNEPIIENPKQAFESLKKGIIDKLVIEDYVFFS